MTKEIFEKFINWAKFKFNIFILWAIPLTSKNKTGKYYYQLWINKDRGIIG